MTCTRSLPLVFVVLCGAAAFVFLSGQAMPAVLASHFDFTGQADGRTSLDDDLTFMIAFVVGTPALLVIVAHFFGVSGTSMNLPHAERWPSDVHPPQATDLSRRRLLAFATAFATAFAGFFAYMHWLIVGQRRSDRAPVEHGDVRRTRGLRRVRDRVDRHADSSPSPGPA